VRVIEEHGAATVARLRDGTFLREKQMGKGNRGNKEARKPKRAIPVTKTPVTGAAPPTVAIGFKAVAQKK
jgi:hypothetical protein